MREKDKGEEASKQGNHMCSAGSRGPVSMSHDTGLTQDSEYGIRISDRSIHLLSDHAFARALRARRAVSAFSIHSAARQCSPFQHSWTTLRRAGSSASAEKRSPHTSHIPCSQNCDTLGGRKNPPGAGKTPFGGQQKPTGAGKKPF